MAPLKSLLCFNPGMIAKNRSTWCPPIEETNELADGILDLILSAPNKEDLTAQINTLLSPYEWYGGLAKAVLDRLCEVSNSQGRQMDSVAKRAFKKAKEVAKGLIGYKFCKVAPNTTVATGVMALVVPEAVEALGFVENKLIDGSLAACWLAGFEKEEIEALAGYFGALGMEWSKI